MSLAQRIEMHPPAKQPVDLAERETELGVLQEALGRARAGAGSVVLIEAPAGHGKSSLIHAGAALAEASGVEVLSARGSEAELGFPFGVAIQLLEDRFRTLHPAERESVIEGPAQRGADLLDGGRRGSLSESPEGYAEIRGLFWLLRNLVSAAADRLPVAALALFVDDAHWADLPSLRFLAYLGRRIGELPVLVVLSATVGETMADRTALSALRQCARDAILYPDPLSPAATAELVRKAQPDAELAFVHACWDATSGSPWLLSELLREVRSRAIPADAVTAARLEELVPASVGAAVRSRLQTVSSEAQRVACAVSVLGDGADPHHVAVLCGLDADGVSRATEELSRKQLLRPAWPLSFVNLLIRAATTEGIPVFEREHASRLAVARLAGDLPLEPHIRARRALEVPSVDVAEGEITGRGRSRADAEGFATRLAEARDRGQALLADVNGPPTAGQREALANMAMYEALRGAHRSMVADLVGRALADAPSIRTLIDEGLDWTLLVGALLFVDELERALEICEDALAYERENEPRLSASMRHCRGWLLYERGLVADAAADAYAALDARLQGAGSLRTAYGLIACCHVQQGHLAQAETVLAGIDHPDVQDSIHLPFLLDARAQLRFVQLRPREALRDALEAGALLQRELGADSPGAIAWRSTAAFAHLALGEPARARELATEELEYARRTGITRVAIRDLRVLGLAERGSGGIQLLRDAVDLGTSHPDRLEHVLALLDLGAALRRANRRAAAREPLREALDRALAGGAGSLAERARKEFAATGVRHRRTVLNGAAALTPGELRVGDLAARGLTTRQVAETLFITPKTVEFHLRGIYRKLEISSRSELAEILRDELASPVRAAR